MRYFQRGFAALVIVLAWPFAPPVQAQSGGACPGIGTVTPLATETIAVSSTAVPFTAAKISSSTRSASMAIGYTTAAIRYWDDGSTPTATVGMPVAASERFQVCGVAAIRAFLMIRQSGDASVSVSYYGG